MVTNFPQGPFRVVYADPAWNFKSNSMAKPGRNPRRHYRCMSIADIAALPVRDVVAEDAMCLLWITPPFLAIGAHLPILKAWGFKPSTIGYTWMKLNQRGNGLFMGTGFTTRGNAEFVVLGKRGRLIRRDAGVSSAILSPVREHSRKPDELYERIERYAAGPYLEMFARSERPGWTAWGDEVGKFKTIETTIDASAPVMP